MRMLADFFRRFDYTANRCRGMLGLLAGITIGITSVLGINWSTIVIAGFLTSFWLIFQMVFDIPLWNRRALFNEYYEYLRHLPPTPWRSSTIPWHRRYK